MDEETPSALLRRIADLEARVNELETHLPANQIVGEISQARSVVPTTQGRADSPHDHSLAQPVTPLPPNGVASPRTSNSPRLSQPISAPPTDTAPIPSASISTAPTSTALPSFLSRSDAFKALRDSHAAGHRASASTPVTISYQTPSPNAVPHGNFERAIGLKLAGWAGAITLLIGLALGVKYVYEQNWFGAVPPIVWLGVIFCVGFALIGVGEVVYRRISPLSSAGIFGAGVATLFLAAYVGDAYYQIYSSAAALTLMAIASLIGAAVALRGNLVSIAVLALLGGNLAPLLVGDRHAPLTSFLIYLLALQLVALVLASVGRGRKWWTLRGLSLATTGLWVWGCFSAEFGGGLGGVLESMLGGLFWGPFRGASGQSPVFAFATVYAALYQLEPIVTSLRRRIEDAAADPLAFAIVTTGAFTALLLGYTQADSPQARGCYLLLLALIVGFIGIAMTLLGRRGARFANAKNLALAHRWSAVGLLALAAPVTFHGAPVEAAWAVMAIILGIVGARAGSHVARYAAAIVWALAVAHLAIDAQAHPLVSCTIDGIGLTRQLFIAGGLALAGQIIAGLLAATKGSTDGSADASADAATDAATNAATDTSTQSAANILSAVASILWIVATYIGLPPMWATAAAAGYAWLLLLGARACPMLYLAEQAMVVLGLASVNWTVDAIGQRITEGWKPDDRRLLINAQFSIAAVLAGSIALLPKLSPSLIPSHSKSPSHSSPSPLRAALRGRSGKSAAFITAALLLMLAVSLEIDRGVLLAHARGLLDRPIENARQLALTACWMIGASVALVLLRMSDRAPNVSRHWPNYLPIVLRLIAAKFLVIDLLVLASANAGLIHGLPVLNLGCFVAAIVLIGLSLDVTGWPAEQPANSDPGRSMAMLLSALVVWIAGSNEIARMIGASVFHAGSALLSVYWSALAIAAVTVGFAMRDATLRYFGLTLFALTCLKVVIIDLSELQTGYRVLSFMGLGVLLIGTSVVYGRFGPRLLAEGETVTSSPVSGENTDR